jgi:hypothetical protein
VQATIAALGALLISISVANALVPDIAVIGASLLRDARTVVAKLAGLAVIDGSPVKTAIRSFGTLFKTVAVANALVLDTAIIGTAGHAGTVIASLVSLAIGMRPVETTIRSFGTLFKTVAVANAQTIGRTIIDTF